MYRIGDFSKRTGISISTLRLWDKNGKFKPAVVTKGGQRMYTDEQLFALQQASSYVASESKKVQRIVVGYCRVSTRKQIDDLNRQEEAVRMYLLAQGKPFRIISDIGSGINYKKDGLVEILQMIMRSEVEKVVVLHKDRLVRFGYELVETVCSQFHTALEVIDLTPKSNEEELVEDMIQIVTVFSCRLQGKRAGRAKKFIEEMNGELLNETNAADQLPSRSDT